MTTTTPAPPRPSSINEPGPSMKKTPTLTSNNRSFGLGMVCGTAIATLLAGFFIIASDKAVADAPAPEPVAVVNEDPTPVATVIPTPTVTATPVTEQPAAPINEEPVNEDPVAEDLDEYTLDSWPFTTGETLVCGPDAKPALDYRDDAIGWWAYCEPALVEK